MVAERALVEAVELVAVAMALRHRLLAVDTIGERILLDGAGLRAEAHARRDLLLDLAEEDATAYASVVRARRMPKESPAELEARAAALRTAMIDAARVPLRTATVAAEVLALAERIAPIGNRNAVSDAGVAAQLAAAALRGALLNVRINIPYLPAGEPLRLSAPDEITRLEALASERETAAMRAVVARLAPS